MKKVICPNYSRIRSQVEFKSKVLAQAAGYEIGTGDLNVFNTHAMCY